ncbi:MAG: PQQ-binding-like beta-propeller repeat protein [Planctomycetota bacterium]|nr:PQQ-binding-like beta-propeller repeat protein [Planctomycetota bacterium]
MTPGRNMVSPEKDLPGSFDPGKKNENTGDFDLATAKNVKWIAKLGSQCYSNPVVAGGKVYIGTNNASPRDPKIAANANGPQDTGDRGILLCLDEATGKFLWQLAVPKLKAGKANDWDLVGICAVAAVDGDRVYVVTNRCELLCLDANGMANGNDGPFRNEGQYVLDPDKLKGKGPEDFKDLPVNPASADIIWRLDMIETLGVFPHNASNCAVLVDGATVYCCTSNGADWTHEYVPSAQSPSIIAVNKHTGAVLWEDQLGLANGTRLDCGLSRRIFHGQWSSPSLAQVNGKKQVYFGGGDGCLYALDALDGHAIWWADCVLPGRKKNEKGFIPYTNDPSGPSEIDATPVFHNNRVYVANGRDPEEGEGAGVLTCLDATKTGDITGSGKVWVYDKIGRSNATVAIADGLLFTADFSGAVHCLDAETGAVYWVHQSRAHIWGSVLLADGKLYFGTEDGDAFIMEAGKTAKVLSKVNVDSPIYGTAVVANGVVYIATQSHLFAITKK